MENNIQIFNNSEFGKLEVIAINGAPHFPATACAEILGYAKPHDAVSRHCPHSVKHGGVSYTTNQFGVMTEQAVEKNYIPEGDLYRLIARSKLPEAERFERWVFDDVLPSIRQTGAYLTPAAMEQLVNDPQTLIVALTAYQREIEAHAETRAAKEQLQLEAEVNEPKVKLADAITVSDSTILIRELAKILKGNGIDIGEKRLFERLREEGYLIKKKGSDYNSPSQMAMELGLFVINEKIIPQGNGRMILCRTPRVTGKGQQYFVNRYMVENTALVGGATCLIM